MGFVFSKSTYSILVGCISFVFFLSLLSTETGLCLEPLSSQHTVYRELTAPSDQQRVVCQEPASRHTCAVSSNCSQQSKDQASRWRPSCRESNALLAAQFKSVLWVMDLTHGTEAWCGKSTAHNTLSNCVVSRVQGSQQRWFSGTTPCPPCREQKPKLTAKACWLLWAIAFTHDKGHICFFNAVSYMLHHGINIITRSL
jgi:hypothetical protein